MNSSFTPTAVPVISSKSGFELTSNANLLLLNNLLVEDERVFNNFVSETEIHVPVEILDVSGFTNCDAEYARCLDMPVRMQGDNVYSFPDDWVGLQDIFQQIINIEHTNNPNWQDYYTYLSVDYTPFLDAGEQQRHAGCHTDGFQGARHSVRTKTSRSYVMVTNGGTRFFPQHFVSNLDSTKFNVFTGFDLQVDKDVSGESIFSVADERKFYFFDAYTVHESGAANRPGSRLFVRLTWEMKLFDRVGNTKNSLLDYDWNEEAFDIRSGLIAPTVEDIENARMVHHG